MTPIAENLARVRERIARACHRAGRDPSDVRLVAVSKTVETERIRAALAAGVTEIGENYIQEAEAKLSELHSAGLLRGVTRHFIGHLQTNKAGKAVEWFDMIQTVDSARLASALGRRAAALGKTQDILLEVNTSGEASKFGVAPAETLRLAEQAAAIEGLHLSGLMTIGPLSDNPAAARPCFEQLGALFQQLPPSQRQVLSMGMSGDLEVAIDTGATLVRVGTAIFGPRR